MAGALGPAATLLGKVFSMLSEAPVAAYVDSLELGHNSEQIKVKLAHTRDLLHNAQVSNVGHNPGLQDLLPALSKNADQAENLLDELHYFQIHDRLHGTSYATTRSSFLRHRRNALRHTASSWAACFSCSSAHDDSDPDELHFHPVTMSRKIKSVLQDMQIQCDSVSDLLCNIPVSSMSLSIVLQRPQIGSTFIQDTLYGRRDTFEQVVSYIISCEQTISVLPIVGPGGIGKTTFTQHLYHDARLYNDTGAENHFAVRAWVCVSTNFDVLKLTREILGCITATENEESRSVASEATNLDQLQNSIAHHLKSKRFLIVLDDIWKCDGADQWKTLLAPFTKGEINGSMILVTTRFPKLANMMGTVDPLELQGLESNDFFTFFEACVFGDRKPEKYEHELAGIAEKIANKLKGSPLAAKTVGRLLQKDLSQKHWNGVLEKHDWLSLENNYDIMACLKISYDYLPFQLKKCFSYFGLFPEDHVYYHSEMNRLLVAVGIIDSSHQVDRNYLEELVDNGFLMKGVNYLGRCCYILHDLMHELCRSVSAQECLNISDLDFRAESVPQSVRHLSITIEDIHNEIFEEEICKLRGRIDIANLRTLMILRGCEERNSNLLNDCFKEINSLRVLFIEVNSPESFPHRFSELIHLRYLKVSSRFGDRVSLPGTLSRFYHLKFLDLDDWQGSSGLPKDFSHLENLHDFRAKSELHSNIHNVGKIKHLQELKEFHVRKGSMGFELKELGALTKLEGALVVRGLEHVATKEEAVGAKLMLKRNLMELELFWSRYRPTIDDDVLDALQPHSNLRVLTIANPGCTSGPSWLCLDIWLTSLETLTLEGISWSTLPPFDKLLNLKILNLKRISRMRQFGHRRCGAPDKCFMRLKEVGFHEMPELTEWIVEPNCHSFSSLEVVECVKCPNLHIMPFSELSCTNLCKLKVYGCPKMSLPSMPHTSTLTDLVVNGYDSDPGSGADLEDGDEMLNYNGKKLVVSGYGGDLAFHNLDEVENMIIKDVSHISLTDIKKLKLLKRISARRCDSLFPEELDDSIIFLSVKKLILDVSHLTIKSSSKLLNYFPALSVLKVYAYPDHDYEERVVHFPSSSSLQELSFTDCKGLVLVPVENGGGIQVGRSSVLSLEIYRCGKLFSQWPMGEGAGSGAQTFYPFPASLGEISVWDEPSMKSMALLSNLTSLTSLVLVNCSNLTVDGFNPLITVNLKALSVVQCNTFGAADLLSEVANTKLLPAGYISRLETLIMDDVSGCLVAPICNLLAPSLRTLWFNYDNRVESFTEEQDKALQLLTSLQHLRFLECTKIQSMPKEGFPVSLRKLDIIPHLSGSPDLSVTPIDEQLEKIKKKNPDLCVYRG